MDCNKSVNETQIIETNFNANETQTMTVQNIEIPENYGAKFNHQSLIQYSNVQLDFIKNFGKRVFVALVGKSKNDLENFFSIFD